jgi:hypothetical protein
LTISVHQAEKLNLDQIEAFLKASQESDPTHKVGNAAVCLMISAKLKWHADRIVPRNGRAVSDKGHRCGYKETTRLLTNAEIRSGSAGLKARFRSARVGWVDTPKLYGRNLLVRRAAQPKPRIVTVAKSPL